MGFGPAIPSEVVKLNNIDSFIENRADPYYNNVILHLNATGNPRSDFYGTDAYPTIVCCQHLCDADITTYTFIDQSSYKYKQESTVYQGRYSTTTYKFGTGSCYFDGTSATYKYTALTDNGRANLGTGDFTVFYWINTTQNVNARVEAVNAYATTTNYWGLGHDYDSTTKVHFGYYASSAYRILSSTTSVSDGLWHQIAVTRKSGTLRLFVDGVKVAEDSTYGNFQCGGNVFIVGGQNNVNNQQFVGYIQEVVAITGVALWTSDFTPSNGLFYPVYPIKNPYYFNNSTLTFDADNNSSTTFIDTNLMWSTWTRYSTPVLSTTTSAYGSGSLYKSANDAGDWYTQTAPYADLFAHAQTPNWTIEANIKADWGSASSLIVYGGLNKLIVLSDRVRCLLRKSDNSGWWTHDFLTTVPSNTWCHVAIGRDRNTLYAFLDGTLIQSQALNETNIYNGTSTPTIGGDNSASSGPGYIDNFSYLAYTCKYTSSFSVKSNNIPHSSDSFKDYSKYSKNIFSSASNNVSVSNFSKFRNTKSIICSSNTSHYLRNYEATTAYSLQSEDFTIEGWYYINSLVSNSALLRINTWAANGAVFHINHASYTSKFSVWIYNINSTTPIMVSTNNVTTSKWCHIAITRKNNIFRLFINGKIEATYSGSGSITSTTGYYQIAEGLNGYLQDFRITKNIARYVTEFSVPTAPFPTRGGNL
jgi:hypothetical protein